MKITSTTRRKLEALYASEERRHLLLIRKHIASPLGNWQCHPNPYAPKRGTAKLTAELLPVPTVPIPIEEQITGRMAPVEVAS